MNRDIIVIGASAGGVKAIPRLLGSLSAATPAAIFVTQHISPHSNSRMPNLISRGGGLAAEHPRDGAKIRHGRIYVAPPDYLLILGQDVVRLVSRP